MSSSSSIRRNRKCLFTLVVSSTTTSIYYYSSLGRYYLCSNYCIRTHFFYIIDTLTILEKYSYLQYESLLVGIPPRGSALGSIEETLAAVDTLILYWCIRKEDIEKHCHPCRHVSFAVCSSFACSLLRKMISCFDSE